MRIARIEQRSFQAVIVAVLIVSASGCGGCSSKKEYPPNLTFPSRADRLVLKSPEQQPARVNEPGKLDEELAALDALGGKTAEPGTVRSEDRAALDKFLGDFLGTPGAPKLTSAMDPEVGAVAQRLKLSEPHLAEGSRLFRRHCLQCHNLAGDGRGPAGLWVIPYPRDYRRGEFKFVSSGEGGKPRRADLLRTLNDGLKGTAMPSFGLLPEGERDLLAGYVMYLSIRGETEYQSLAGFIRGEQVVSVAKLHKIVTEWDAAEKTPPPPTEPTDGEPGSTTHQEAVRRGYKLFTTKLESTVKPERSCLECHGEFGRKALLRYDVWGTVAKPADFTQSHLKGSTRAEDVFARIRFGIAPVGMPAHPKLSDRDVWDLVRFVRSVPFPVQLPPDVRGEVYPNP